MELNKQENYRVPLWVKVVFFAVAIALVSSLIFFQLSKRQAYKQLFDLYTMRFSPLSGKASQMDVLGGDGQTIKVPQFSNKWVLLHFWATWCLSCREEMPGLIALQKKWGSQLEIITVSVDDDFTEVEKFFSYHPSHKMAIFWDKDKQAASLYGVKQFPESFLISPSGDLTGRFAGSRPWEREETTDFLKKIMRSGKNNKML